MRRLRRLTPCRTTCVIGLPARDANVVTRRRLGTATISAMLDSMTPRFSNLLGFLACAGMMSYALYAQHGLGLEPCPLCVFQRVAVIASGLVFLLAALHGPRAVGRRSAAEDSRPPGG